jgi:two-component system chemotaxis response regulator CheY
MKTILLVDDSSYARSVIKKIVTRVGFEVIGEAGDGEEAVAKYKELSPDIVSLDLAMEGTNGIDALKQIMQHDPNAYVIVISSIAGQEAVAQSALAFGAKCIFEKPLHIAKFEQYALKEKWIETEDE